MQRKDIRISCSFKGGRATVKVRRHPPHSYSSFCYIPNTKTTFFDLLIYHSILLQPKRLTDHLP